MARRPAWRSRRLNRRGSAPAAEIDPRLGAGARPSGQELRFRSVGDGGHHRADEPGGDHRRSRLGSSDTLYKSAIAVSGIPARSAASCEPDGSRQHGSIRCRSPSMRSVPMMSSLWPSGAEGPVMAPSLCGCGRFGLAMAWPGAGARMGSGLVSRERGSLTGPAVWE